MSPFGSPVGSSRTPENPRTETSSGALTPMKDPRPPGRVSRRLASEVAERLSPRDRELLTLVARLRVLTGGQLARLFWVEGKPDTRARLARKALSRLSELGVLEPLPRRIGGVRSGSSGLTFAVGRVGQRILATEQPSSRRIRRAYAPGLRYLAHALSVAELYVALTEAQRWELLDLLAFDPEPICWRRYPGPYGAPLVAKPDAFLRLGVGALELSWCIEMDLATEAPVTLTRKAQVYIDLYRSGVVQATDGVFPRVAWIAPDEPRAVVIREALAGLPKHPGLFVVTTTDDAVTELSTEMGS
jgi:hypothetical protein